MNKRTFLKSSTMIGLGSLVSFRAFSKLVDAAAHLPSEAVAKDDDFWTTVRGYYKLKPDYINLENGYYCIQPQVILEQYTKHIQEVNIEGAYYMRTVQFDNKKAAAAKLAAMTGVSAEELILTRNTTELRIQVVLNFTV